MGVDNGRLLAYLAGHGEVLSKHYTDSRVVVHCRIPERAMGHLRHIDTSIRPHNRAIGAAETNGAASNGSAGTSGAARHDEASTNGKQH